MHANRFLTAALALLFASAATPTALFAAPHPAVVHWQVTQAPSKPLKPGAKFNVVVTGTIDPGWHLYALAEPAGGPIATEIALTEGDAADLLHVDQSKPKVIPDPVFQVPTGFFEGSAAFTLHLQLAPDAAPGAHTLHLLLRYQSCNDRVCLPPHTDTVEVALTTGK
jgi:thiol:disulfide interchange protein DsbD